MASYSSPDQVTYSFGLLAFTSALTHAVKPPPKHNQGRVLDIHVRVTVTFTAVTTPAFVNVGTAATAAKYAQLNMSTAAAGVSYNLIDGAGSPLNLALVIFSDINLPRDGVSAIQFQVVPMTGGSPAGSGFLDIGIDWF